MTYAEQQLSGLFLQQNSGLSNNETIYFRQSRILPIYTDYVEQLKDQQLQAMSFKNKNLVKEGVFFTHFATLPFLLPHQRQHIAEIQHNIRALLHTHPKFQEPQLLREHSHKLSHITLFKLALPRLQMKQKLLTALNEFSNDFQQLLRELPINFKTLNYFTRFNKNRKAKEVTVIYIQLQKPVVDFLNYLVDKVIRKLLHQQVVATEDLKRMDMYYDHNCNMYKPETYHVTLFRAQDLIEDDLFLDLFQQLQSSFQPTKFECASLDISTMGEYDESQFYRPLHRFSLK